MELRLLSDGTPLFAWTLGYTGMHVLLFMCVPPLVCCVASYGLAKRTSMVVPWETSCQHPVVAEDGGGTSITISQQYILDPCRFR